MLVPTGHHLPFSGLAVQSNHWTWPLLDRLANSELRVVMRNVASFNVVYDTELV